MTSMVNTETASPEIVRLLAPSGVLRAGINLSNFLLVSSRTQDGEPAGVSPDMARAFAEKLGVALRYVTYASPGLLADAAARDEWDIALIGAELEATYLVPPGSALEAIAEVDQPGRRIAVTDRTAYGLWLDRNIKHAELVRAKTFEDAVSVFLEQKLDALAGLRPRLFDDVAAIPGSRMLPGRYMAVQQAMGTPRRNEAALQEMTRFVAAEILSGRVADLIARHSVSGITVARSAV